MATKPRRPMSAYMFWLDSVREQMKAEDPRVKVIDIIKKGKKLWHEMEDKSVWEDMAAKAKAQYATELEAYNANAVDADSESTYNSEQSDSNDESSDDTSENMADDDDINYLHERTTAILDDTPEQTSENIQITHSNKITNKPRRPHSAYMFWLDSVREQMKAEDPRVKVCDIIKKGQELWHKMQDKSVWEDMADKAKAQYAKELEAYNANAVAGTEST